MIALGVLVAAVVAWWLALVLAWFSTPTLTALERTTTARGMRECMQMAVVFQDECRWEQAAEAWETAARLARVLQCDAFPGKQRAWWWSLARINAFAARDCARKAGRGST